MRVTFKVAVKTVIVLAAGLAVALAAALRSFDFDSYKGVLAERFEAATGRKIVIAGRLKLRLGLVPALSAERVSVANAPWGSRAEMASVERIDAEVALLPLLSSEVRIRRLVLVKPDVLLEIDARGNGNWEFAGAEEADAEAVSSPVRFEVSSVRVKDGRFAWRDGGTGRAETVFFSQASLDGDKSGGGTLALNLAGEYSGHPFDLAGRVGSAMALYAGRPFPLDAEGSLAGIRVRAEGTMADPFASEELDLLVGVGGDELADLPGWSALVPGTVPAPGPFKALGRLGAKGGKLTLALLEAEAGGRDFVAASAKGVVADLLAPSGIDLAVTVEGDEAARVVSAFGGEAGPLGPFALTAALSDLRNGWNLKGLAGKVGETELVGDLAFATGTRPALTGRLELARLALPAGPKPADGRLFPADRLPLEALALADADLALKVGTLTLGATRIDRLAADVSLRAGRLTARDLSAKIAGGIVIGEVDFDAASAEPAVAARLEGKGIELGRVLADGKGEAPVSGGLTDFALDYRGRGDSVRALMGSAEATLTVKTGKGSINSSAIDWAAGDILLKVLGSLDPAARAEDRAPLRCGALRLSAKDGVATIDRGLAFETEDVNVVGSGTIDLRTEALDLGFAPSARQGLGLTLGGHVAGLTRVRGTLSEPSVELDPLGAARTAATIGAAVVTSGLSLLGELLFDRVVSDPSPCRTALAGPDADVGGKAN